MSINTLSLAPAGLGDHIDTVVRLGARGMSPDLLQVKELGVGKTARKLRDAGLEVATLTHRAFAYCTRAEAKAAQDRLCESIEIAGQIGAQTIIMTTGGRGDLRWAEATDRFAEAITPCVPQAAALGIKLGIEPTSHLYADASIAHRLADAAAIARKAGIGLILDLFPCWVDSDIEAAIAEAGPLIVLIQVSDYVYGDRGLPCRAVPGDGSIPLDRLIPAVHDTGFRGYFDLEIIGPRLQNEGQEKGLLRAAEYIGRLLRQAENAPSQEGNGDDTGTCDRDNGGHASL